MAATVPMPCIVDCTSINACADETERAACVGAPLSVVNAARWAVPLRPRLARQNAASVLLRMPQNQENARPGSDTKHKHQHTISRA
jgi:hypothetical protein